MPPFPSSLIFYAYAQYAPRGTEELSVQSQDITYSLKKDGFLSIGGDTVRTVDYAAKSIASRLEEFPFLADCLGPDVALVPVPRSTPLAPHALWPARRIAEAFVANGLGSEVLPLVVRTHPVQRSSQAAPGQRPGPQEHFDSTKVDSQLSLGSATRLTLIDDVITRGATLLGIYPHLQAAFPDATICCFAVIRTVSLGEIDSIRSPVKGDISVNDYGRPTRAP